LGQDEHRELGVQGRDQRRLPLPEEFGPAERDFHLELRRLVGVAGLTYRALEAATSGPVGSGEPTFYSKSRWGRWMNGQSHPPRKAIKRLADTLAAEQIDADGLLELWDKAFASSGTDEADGVVEAGGGGR
jgi:hypothetical protein